MKLNQNEWPGGCQEAGEEIGGGGSRLSMDGANNPPEQWGVDSAVTIVVNVIMMMMTTQVHLAPFSYT